MAAISAKIEADVSGFRKAMRDAQKYLQQFTNEQSIAAQTARQMNDVTKEQVDAYNKVVKSMMSATDGTKTIAQASKQLQNDIERLKIQWNNLSETAKKSKFGQNIQRSIQQATNQLNQLTPQVRQASTALQSGFGGGMSSALSTFGLNLGSVGGLIGKLVPLAGAGAGAMKMLGDAFNSCESNIDMWGESCQRARGAYDLFVKSLANGEGLQGFFAKFSQNDKENSIIYKLDDEIGSMEQNNAYRLQNLRARIAELREEMAQGLPRASLLESFKDEYEKLMNTLADKKMDSAIIKIANTLDESVGEEDRKAFAKKLLEQGQELMDYASKRLEELNKKTGNKTNKSIVGANGLTTTILVDEKVYQTSKALQDEYKMLSSLIREESAENRKLGIEQATIAAKAREEVKNYTKEISASITAQNNKVTEDTRKAAEEERKSWIERRNAQIQANKIEEQARKQYEQSISNVRAMVNKQSQERSNKGFQDWKNLINPNKTQATQEITAPTNPYDGITSRDALKQTINDMQSLTNSIEGVGEAMNSIKNAENPFEMFKGLLSLTQNIMGVVDGVQAVATAMETLGIVSDTTTATEVANSQLRQQTTSQETAGDVTAAGAGFMKANSKIPIVGIAIAAAAVASMLAIMAATKSKAKKFAKGGIISGPTYGLMGEYPGASNNPEVVAPLNKLRSLLGDNGTNNVKFVIEGRTLVGIMNKENRHLTRM